MDWKVDFDPAFDAEFDALPIVVQDELLAHAKLLEAFGPKLGRPWVVARSVFTKSLSGKRIKGLMLILIG